MTADLGNDPDGDLDGYDGPPFPENFVPWWQRSEICTHPPRREIADPETRVEHNRLLEIRVWFCKNCGHKWTTTRKIGDVDSIELRINLT